jgi:pilus assembly protein CpaE
VVVLANRVQAGPQLEISRKDFEGSIERKIDFVVPFDQKLAAQAAKLGKTIAEAGKGSKTTAPLTQLATRLCATSDASHDKSAAAAAGGKAKGGSLIGRFTGLKSLLGNKQAGAKAK